MLFASFCPASEFGIATPSTERNPLDYSTARIRHSIGRTDDMDVETVPFLPPTAY
jgi:hypothetical protein